MSAWVTWPCSRLPVEVSACKWWTRGGSNPDYLAVLYGMAHAALQSRFTSPGIEPSFEATTVPILEQFWYTIRNWANRRAATP